MDACTKYAQDVVAGTLPATDSIRLACGRHLGDLEDGHKRGLHFDVDASELPAEFFLSLRHTIGEWAGQPIVLQPWQNFVLGSLWGWQREDGFRRFRTSYFEVLRKNGKSTIAAGVAFLLAFFDDEPGAHVFAAATTEDQADLVFAECVAIWRRSPMLRRWGIDRASTTLSLADDRQKIQRLAGDTDFLDGLNVHGAIINELHAHKTSSMWDVLQSGKGARRQPLTFCITTAGIRGESICGSQHDYGLELVQGLIQDDATFVFIATPEPGADWRDPELWRRVNPNFGVSVSSTSLAEDFARADHIPHEQSTFLQKCLDMWTETSTTWLDMRQWDACPAPPDEADLVGRVCFAGVDLSSTRDITAISLFFPDDDEGGTVQSHFFVPEASLTKREREDRVPYETWAREGLLTATPGNVVDQGYIRQRLGELAERY